MRRKNREQRPPFNWLFVITIAFIVMTWLIAIYLTLKSPNNESIFFDAIVALFTGVAFTGVLYSLHLQREDLQLNREELAINREELGRTREEMREQKEEAKRQLFNQHFQMMLLTFSQKVDRLSEHYLTEEYLADLALTTRKERILLSEAQFIEKFTPERLNAIKVFNDLLYYYDQHYSFKDKEHSPALYLVTLSVTAELASLLRVINILKLEDENFAYLQPLLKKSMENAIFLAQKYSIVSFT